MDKVLVEIYLPAAKESFDMYIPLASKMYEVLQMLTHLLSDLADGKYKPSRDTVICDAETGTIFNINLPVAELGIRNGSKLMVI